MSASLQKLNPRRLVSAAVFLASSVLASGAHAWDNPGQEAFYNLDVIAADNYYQTQLASNANDPEANFFRALTRVLRLFENDGNVEFQNLLDGFGFSDEVGERSLFEFIATPPAALPNNAPGGGDVQAFIEDQLLVELTGAIANLERLGPGLQLTIPVEGWQALGTGDTVPGEIDYADAKVLQGYLGALQATLRTFLVAYDLDVDGALQDHSTINDALAAFPQFLNLVSGGASKLAQAKTEWSAAITAYLTGMASMLNEVDSQDDDLITIAPEDLEGELAFLTELAEMYCSLQGKPLATLDEQTGITCADSGTPRIGGEAINLSRLYDNPVNLRDLLPTLTYDAVCEKDYVDSTTLSDTSPFPDPTLNGLFPGLTQAELVGDTDRLSVEYYDLYGPTTATVYAPANNFGFVDVRIELNEGDLPRKPYSVDSFSLQSGSPFSVYVFDGPTRLCGAGWWRYVEVSFNPTEEGGFTDVLVISSNDPGEETIEIPIRGCTGSYGDCDNDGTPDASDDLPYDPSEQVDTDADGIGNNADTDDDNDGTPDASDAFPTDPDEQLDTDADGIGNNADLDDDGDGVSDLDEIEQGRDPLFNEGVAASIIIQTLLNDE